MNSDQESEGLGIYPREIAAAIYRRRRWVILPILVALALGAIAILLQKPQYRSTATLLIDSQEIPSSIVEAPLSSVANERIAKIRQQVLSREELAALVKDNKLFPDAQRELPADDVLNLVREAINVDLVGALEGQVGGDGGSTIAFTVSFTYSDAQTAQAVTKQLTNIFLVEDKRFRTEKATGTAAFLGRRADELRRQLTRLEDERRTVEARYAGALPDRIALSAQSSSALRAEVARIDAESQALLQQSSNLAAQADQAAQTAPDVAALRRAEEQLNQLTSTYADNYPEVIAARAAVERQRESLARTRAARDNSVIQREISASHARAETLAARRNALVGEIAEIEHNTAQAPQAAYELNMIEREYENIRRQYESLRERQQDAQVAVTMVSEDKGERFSIVNEANLPHHPLGTRPVLILLAALIAGAGMGVAAILAYEFLSGTIHGADTVAKLLGAPPMGIIAVANQPSPFARFGEWLHQRQQREKTT